MLSELQSLKARGHLVDPVAHYLVRQQLLLAGTDSLLYDSFKCHLLKDLLFHSLSPVYSSLGEGNVKDVRIFPCSGNGKVCELKLGTNVTVEADFVARKSMIAN